MKRGRKAQSEVLTTVLIILLVMAIVVILWNVVRGAVGKGTEKIQSQEECLGVMVEIEQISSSDPNRFTIRRADNKEIKNPVSLLVLVDGKPLDSCGELMSCNPGYSLSHGNTLASADEFKTPYTSATLTVMPAVTQKLEVAIKLGDNLCASTVLEI